MQRAATGPRTIALAWLVTRAAMLAIVWHVSGFDLPRMQDVAYYHDVARHLLDERSMPATDMWQYPPGAAFLLLVPQLAGDAAYGVAFVTLMLACDATITALLARAALAGGSVLGVWAWLALVPALREFSFLRFDLVPTTFAVVALLAVSGRMVVFGTLAGIGAAIKAWPIAVLAAQWRPRRLLVAGLASVVAILACVGAAAVVFGDQGGVLDNQSERGLQVESVAAVPWHVAGGISDEGAPIVLRSGSLEIDDPLARQVADALRWATLAAALLVAGWWSARLLLLSREPHRRDWLATDAAGVDLVVVAVLLALVTSRVLSPQFLLWLLGVGAVALTHVDTRLRRPLALVAVAAVATAGVDRSNELLALRNALLVLATVDAGWQLLHGLRLGPAAIGPVPGTPGDVGSADPMVLRNGSSNPERSIPGAPARRF